MLGWDEAKLALGYHYINFNGAALYVEGIKKILRIDGEEMTFQMPKGILRVAGNKLTVSEMSGTTLLVTGEIAAVYTDGVWQSKQSERGDA